MRPQGRAMSISCAGWNAWLLRDNGLENAQSALKKVIYFEVLDNRLESAQKKML